MNTGPNPIQFTYREIALLTEMMRLAAENHAGELGDAGYKAEEAMGIQQKLEEATGL